MTIIEAQKQEPQTIRVVGKLIQAGKTKNGNDFESFVAWKIKNGKYRYDLRFTKSTQDNPDYIDMVKAVANGVATEFDVTVDSVWENTGDKAFKLFFAKNITSAVAYSK